MIIQTVYNGGGGESLTFFCAVAISAKAKSDQEDLSEWTPPGLTEITGGIIKTDTIDARTIAADTITANEIAANAITTSELNADSVTSAKIVAGTIVAGDIAANTITASEIAANAITTSELNADAVTSAKIAGGHDRRHGHRAVDHRRPLNVTTLPRSPRTGHDHRRDDHRRDHRRTTITPGQNQVVVKSSGITSPPEPAPTTASNGRTGIFGSGGEITLNNSGIELRRGRAANNQRQFSDSAVRSVPSPIGSLGGLYPERRQ